MSTPLPEPLAAHAFLHCNLNTVDLDRSLERYTSLVEPGARLIRSSSTDDDGTAMGLGLSTASETVFVYDARGPRSAPALELVGWSRPGTAPAVILPEEACGYGAVGFRVPSLEEARRSGGEITKVRVRGRLVPALVSRDPDGVPLELVEIPPAGTDPAEPALFSHLRLTCRDLSVSVEWYARIGFSEAGAPETDAEGHRRTSLVLPEDPTFSLELMEVPDAAVPVREANHQGVHRIALAVDDVRDSHAALLERLPGTPAPVFIPMPDMATGGFTVLFLSEPDGAVVELVERPRTSVRRPRQPV